jgi:C1A family cysteine protease
MAAPKEQIIGGHAIVMVGFDDKHKRIKFVSFWGSSWGDHGFGYLYLRLRRETSIGRVDLHSSLSIRDPDSQV